MFQILVRPLASPDQEIGAYIEVEQDPDILAGPVLSLPSVDLYPPIYEVFLAVPFNVSATTPSPTCGEE